MKYECGLFDGNENDHHPPTSPAHHPTSDGEQTHITTYSIECFIWGHQIEIRLTIKIQIPIKVQMTRTRWNWRENVGSFELTSISFSEDFNRMRCVDECLQLTPPKLHQTFMMVSYQTKLLHSANRKLHIRILLIRVEKEKSSASMY